MFDVGVIRRDRAAVEAMLRRRKATADLDEIVALDDKRAVLAGRITAIGEERNRLSARIGKTAPAERAELVGRTRELRDQLKAVEVEQEAVERGLRAALLTVPNMLAPDVPEGEDESGNVVVRRWGEPRQFDFKPRDHVEIGQMLDIIDIERAVKVAGTRSYYLKNEAVFLELALVRFALDHLMASGFRPVVPPVLVRENTLWAARFFPFFRDQIYKIEGEDRYLVGTSEVPLAGMHMDEILDEAKLPLLYAAFSSCFRTELGSGGRDIRGLLRTHQFDKVEMFAYVHPDKSEETHQWMVGLEEGIYQQLGVPYQVLLMCSGDLGALAYKKYDIEFWKPADGVYREITSCSNYQDFQARGANVRFRGEAGARPRFVHELNGTAVAIGRTLIAILENHQQADGSVVVPEVLHQYLPKGMEVLRPRR